MLDSIRLEIVLILTQDRCTVCVERTTGSKIDLDAPNGTPTRWAQVEARSRPFKDIANPDTR
jgi:hypothetical protein